MGSPAASAPRAETAATPGVAAGAPSAWQGRGSSRGPLLAGESERKLLELMRWQTDLPFALRVAEEHGARGGEEALDLRAVLRMLGMRGEEPVQISREQAVSRRRVERTVQSKQRVPVAVASAGTER